MELWVTGGTFFAALLWAATRSGESLASRAGIALDEIAGSNRKSSLLIFIIAMCVYALPSLWHVPVPIVHDEFAYLLAGETFAQGRLTNPPHPLSHYFETFHVLQSPTYMAKFPPGPGLFLALGFLIGLPIAGVWLSIALACLALFRMLRAAMPARWALLLSLLAAVHPTIVWFSQTYWGGGVALLGGALLGGAVLRVLRQPTAGDGWIAGAGISILILSRPFEGAILTVVCGLAVLMLAIRNGDVRALLARFAPTLLVLPSITCAWLLYYNLRVTGDPFEMPYALHTSRYMSAPLFFWQSLPPTPNYPNEQMRQFHTQTEPAEYTDELGWPNFPLSFLARGGMILWAYLRSMVLVIPFLIAFAAWRRGRNIAFCLCLCAAVMLIHMAICPWMRIAYMAPLMGLLLVVLGAGLRRLWVWRRNGEPVGQAMVRAIVCTQIVAGLFNLYILTFNNAGSVFDQRAQILRSLKQQGGQHLVLVRYGLDHTGSAEWIYNAPDVDASPIVFARVENDRDEQVLRDYYDHRKVWSLDITNRQVAFQPAAPSAHYAELPTAD